MRARRGQDRHVRAAGRDGRDAEPEPSAVEPEEAEPETFEAEEPEPETVVAEELARHAAELERRAREAELDRQAWHAPLERQARPVGEAQGPGRGGEEPRGGPRGGVEE